MIWILCAILVAEPSPLNFTLQEAIDKALIRNVQHQAVVEKRAEVKGGILEARSAAFPQVTLKSSYSELRSPSMLNSKDFEEFIEQFPEGSFEPQVQPLHTLTVEVNQALFTWGRVKSAIELADIVGQQAEHSIRSSELDIAHKTASAYFLCQTTEEAYQVEKTEKAALEEALKLVQARNELGMATRLDYLRAKSALAEVEPSILQRESDAILAKRNLLQILNLPQTTKIQLAAVDLPFQEPPSLGNLVTASLMKRPDLKEIVTQQDSLNKQKKIQNTIGLPNLEFNGNYGREALYLDNLGGPRYNSWRASIDFSWTLFDGFRKKGVVAQLKSQINQSHLQELGLRNQIRYEVEQALLLYKTGLRKLEVSLLHLEVAQEALEVAEANYREGIALQTEWIDAQQTARKARLDQILAQLNAKLSLTQLARTIGSMPLAPLPTGESQ